MSKAAVVVSGLVGALGGAAIDRLVTVGFPKFEAVANRVNVQRLAGWWGPAIWMSRQFKFGYVVTIAGNRWNIDFYVFTVNGDVEAVMSVYYHPGLKEYMVDLARMGWAGMEVYLGGTLKATMPEVTAEDTVVGGFITFRA